MKNLLSVIALFLGLASAVQASDVKIEVLMGADKHGEPTKTFAADTPQIFGFFKTEGLEDGDKLRGVWVAVDVGDAAPKNSKIDEKTLTAQGDTDNGSFSLSKPTKGWPPGKYRFEIYVNDELTTSAKFTIEEREEATRDKEKESAEESGGEKKDASSSSQIPDEKELAPLTDKSVVAFGGAVKKKDFSEFYDDIATMWKKETTPAELKSAFKDFYGKNIDIPAAIKGKEPVFNHPPKVDSNGVLLVQGYYPTTPNRIVFKLKYIKEESDWKLVGVDVNLKE